MRWTTLFLPAQNVHLTKDVGLIALTMKRQFGYEAQLVCFKNDAAYPALAGEAEGLQLVFLKHQGQKYFLELAVLDFLQKNASQIDVLHLFHLTRDTLFYGNLFKKLNPKGYLYLKMDAYNQHLTNPKVYSNNYLKNLLLKREEKHFFKALDLVSIENKKGLQLLRQTYPQLSGKSAYVPNGCNDTFLDEHFGAEARQNKENIILSVGRPGDAVKNYELLLMALPQLDLNDWKLIVIGKLTPEFQTKWENLLKRNPDMAGKVELTGEISDRVALYTWYGRAKIFFLPSLFESFGIAYAEALYFGCFIIGNHSMAAFEDLSDGCRYGAMYQVNDAGSFAETLQNAMLLTSENTALSEAIYCHARSRFFWSSICTTLHDKIAGNA